MNAKNRITKPRHFESKVKPSWLKQLFFVKKKKKDSPQQLFVICLTGRKPIVATGTTVHPWPIIQFCRTCIWGGTWNLSLKDFKHFQFPAKKSLVIAQKSKINIPTVLWPM